MAALGKAPRKQGTTLHIRLAFIKKEEVGGECGVGVIRRSLCSAWTLLHSLLFSFLRFYLFIHERHTERGGGAETQAEGEAGSMQEA